MDNNIHLTVWHSDGSSNIDRAQVDWRRHDVRWTSTPSGTPFIAWRLIHLNWWDDQSYIAYQSRDLEDE
jgi:hypothetical protein